MRVIVRGWLVLFLIALSVWLVIGVISDLKVLSDVNRIELPSAQPDAWMTASQAVALRVAVASFAGGAGLLVRRGITALDRNAAAR